jgi:hypothetical protein
METTQELIMYLHDYLNYNTLGYDKMMSEITKFRRYFEDPEVVSFLEHSREEAEVLKAKEDEESIFQYNVDDTA